MSKINNLKHHIKSFVFEEKHFGAKKYHKSYSQCGEDLIVRFIFNQLKIDKPSYIDIGAHHPYIISNTAEFYLNGSKGVNIEPNPFYFKFFLEERPNDVNLNIGISENKQMLEYYEFDEPALNTFSEIEKNNLIKEGKSLQASKKIHTHTLQYVLDKFFKNKFPNFMSLDVEGYDMLVLNQIDYDNNFPVVICVETISFSSSGNGAKNQEIINFLLSKGYFLHSDTYINSIFVRKAIWANK